MTVCPHCGCNCGCRPCCCCGGLPHRDGDAARAVHHPATEGAMAFPNDRPRRGDGLTAQPALPLPVAGLRRAYPDEQGWRPTRRCNGRLPKTRVIRL